MKRPSSIRFFVALALQPIYALVLLTAIVMAALWTISQDSRELDSAFGMVLLAQMFLASTGFVPRARRGHFDPILADGRSKAGVAAAHWLISVLPGLLAWLLVTAAGSWWNNSVVMSALAGRRAAAWLIVSALAWSAGFLLPRGAAGVLWVACLVALLIRGGDVSGWSPGGLGLPGGIIAAMMCPFVLMGGRPPGTWASAIAAGIAVTVLLCVWSITDELDIYLVDYA